MTDNVHQEKHEKNYDGRISHTYWSRAASERLIDTRYYAMS